MTDTTIVSPARPAWQSWCAALGVALIAFLVFFATTRFGFVGFDDGDNVFNNAYLNPVTSQTVKRFWSEDYFELYTPVTYTLWTAVASLPQSRLEKPVSILSGTESYLAGQPFHLLGVSLHAVSSVLLFWLLSRLPLLRGRSPIYAALGAAIWAIHPLQAESVAWVTGNNNVFSGVFMIAALLAFTFRTEAKKSGTVLGWYLLATILYVLALLAKPTAAALPMVAFALFVGAFRQPVRSLLLPLGAWLFLAAGLLFVTRNTVSSVKDVSLPIWQRPFVVGDALAFYAGKLLLPVRMGIDYARQPPWLRTQAWFYAMWLIPVAIGVLLYLWHKRTANKEPSRTVLSGFAVFTLGALPMLGIAPYYFHRYSTVADRYVYLALIGVAMVVAVVLSQLPRQTRAITTGTAMAGIAVYGFLGYQQSLVWRDTLTLFTHAAAVSPDSQMAHFNRALALRDMGDSQTALEELNKAAQCRPEGNVVHARVLAARGAIYFGDKRYDEAIRDTSESIRLYPGEYLPYINLAIMFWEVGEHDKARATLDAALIVSGKRRDYIYPIAAKVLQYGISELALPYLEEAAKSSPQAGEANYILGVLANNRNDNVQAEKYLRAAARLTPASGEVNYSLARILDRRGKQAEAQTYYQKAEALGFRPPKPVQ